MLLESTAPAPPDSKPARPSVRRASFEDYDQIAAVEASNGLAIKSRQAWMRLWTENPAYRQLPGWPIGWVLETHDHRIVGSLGNVPCLYRFQRKTYVGAFGRGWAVDSAHRPYALLLLIAQLQQPGVDLRVTNTASASTSALLAKCGWKSVPVGRWDQSVFWVTSYRHTVRRAIEAKLPTPIATLAGWSLNGPLMVKDWILRRRRTASTRYALEWRPDFDSSFETFWAELESRHSSVLLPERNLETLLWHYQSAIAQNRLWILTASEGGRLVASMLLELREAQSIDVSRALLVDFQSVSAEPGLANAMLVAALNRCASEGVHLLENPGCWLEQKHLVADRAPHRRSLGGWCYLYNAANPELAGALQNRECWDPTQYDADASL
jgi:hypothetical protein